MKALITGASSGIGVDMARILSSKGYDLILVARNKRKLEKLKKEMTTNVEIIIHDLSSTFNCMELYNKVKNEDIEIVINNAGFGVYGEFFETSLDKELDMVDLNIKAVHILTKLFLRDFKKKNHGYILNVSSLAAFAPGPLMASYYATKAYVLKLTEAIYEELRQEGSNIYIGALCPGPVTTNFNKIAGIKKAMNALPSYVVAEYTIKKMFKRKTIIIPGKLTKMVRYINILLPNKTLSRFVYIIQKRKNN
ncbi:MAG: SDR family NAD(P)-dependent oxidoreductase [Mollicutes bacterium]|nr:SDR family NAD(P)-dependent oxidoreductase [Mollicutes bacterium]